MVDKINCWSISKQGQIELSPMMRRCHPTTQSILNSDLYSGVCAVCVPCVCMCVLCVSMCYCARAPLVLHCSSSAVSEYSSIALNQIAEIWII